MRRRRRCVTLVLACLWHRRSRRLFFFFFLSTRMPVNGADGRQSYKVGCSESKTAALGCISACACGTTDTQARPRRRATRNGASAGPLRLALQPRRFSRVVAKVGSVLCGVKRTNEMMLVLKSGVKCGSPLQRQNSTWLGYGGEVAAWGRAASPLL